MEPVNSPSSDRDDARLEAWLRQPMAPLSDDGFSRRVMATLPPRRISATSTLRHVLGRLALRFAIGAAGAAVGAGVALARGFSFSDLRAALESVGTQLGDPTTLAALGVAAAAVIYALRPRKLLRLLVLK